MKNLKIGVKLTCGFILVALITLAVGIIGWRGVDNLDGHLTEVGEVRLPSVQSLLDVDAASGVIMMAQRSLLNPRMPMEDRNRQYQNIERGLQRIQAALDIYAPLPQTSEEEILWRQFVPVWDEFRRQNEEFTRMSRELEATGVLNPVRLRAELQQFRGDHHELMGRVMTMIRDGQPFRGGDDHTACNFGRWMAGFQTDNRQIRDILAGVNDNHGPFHQGIASAQQRVLAGDIRGAEDLLLTTIIPGAQGTFARFDQLLAEAATAESLYAAMEAQAMGASRARYDEAMDLLAQIIQINEQVAEQSVIEAHQDAVQAEALAIAGAVVGVILALGLGFILTRIITRPIIKGVAFAESIAEGDLSQQLDIDQKDEIGQLASALNNMVEKLRDVVSDVRGSSDNVAAGIGQLASALNNMVEKLRDVVSDVRGSSDNVAAGSQQLSASSEEMSQGATEQAAAAEEASSSMEQMAANIRQNADNAMQTEKIAAGGRRRGGL
nr:methyl-accepting chemotaxis protein [Geoalkalibacter ferrihydriticus]